MNENIQKKDLASRTGLLLKNLPDDHDLEAKTILPIDINTYFQKLVSEKTLKKEYWIDPKDIFKGMVFLDYLTNCLLNDYQVCNNIVKISEVAKNKIKDSQLPLDMLVIEAGLYTKEKPKDYFTNKTKADAMKKRYEEQNFKVDFDSKTLRPEEPYYNAIGHMVVDQISATNQQYLANISERSQLKALMFTDCIFKYMKKQAGKKKIKKALDQNDFFNASVIALDSFRKEVSLSSISNIYSYFTREEHEFDNDRDDDRNESW